MHGLNRHLRKEVARGHFEFDDKGGLFLPKSRITLGGNFVVTHHAVDGSALSETIDSNIVCAEGRQHVLDVIFDGGTQVTTWYIGIFEGNYTPLDTVTAATVAGAATECITYDEATRPEYSSASPIVDDTADNSDSRAIFTFNASKTVYGSFLVSTSAKSGTTGTLLAISRFNAAKTVASAEDLTVSYLFTAADA